MTTSAEAKLRLKVSVLSEEPHRFRVFVKPDDNVAAFKAVISTAYAQMYPEKPCLKISTHLKDSDRCDVPDYFQVKDAFLDGEVLVQQKHQMSPDEFSSNKRPKCLDSNGNFYFLTPDASHFFGPKVGASRYQTPLDYASAIPPKVASSNLRNDPSPVISRPVSSNNGTTVTTVKSKKSVRPKGLNHTNAHTPTNDNKDIDCRAPELSPKASQIARETLKEGEVATTIKKRKKRKRLNKKAEDGTIATEKIGKEGKLALVYVRSAMEAEGASIGATDMEERTETEIGELMADQVETMAKEAKEAEAAASVAEEKRKSELLEKRQTDQVEKVAREAKEAEAAVRVTEEKRMAELKVEEDQQEATLASLISEAEQSKARAESVKAEIERVKAEDDCLKAQLEQMEADRERRKQEQKCSIARRKAALEAKADWDAYNKLATEEYRKAHEGLEERRFRMRLAETQKIAEDDLDNSKALWYYYNHVKNFPKE